MCMLLLFMKCLSSWCFVRIPSMLYCNMLMDFCLLMFCCGAGCVGDGGVGAGGVGAGGVGDVGGGAGGVGGGCVSGGGVIGGICGAVFWVCCCAVCKQWLHDQCGVYCDVVLSVVHFRWNHSLQFLQRTDPPEMREDVMGVVHVEHMYVFGPGLVSMSPANSRRRDSIAGFLSPVSEKMGIE